MARRGVKKGVSEEDIIIIEYLKSRVYKFANQDKNLQFMRSTTQQQFVDSINSSLKSNPDLSEGFKYAYLQFIDSYSRRDYSVLEQMCEKTLLNAIKSEPLRNDELIKYKKLDK
jgi:hypothetical protein